MNPAVGKALRSMKDPGNRSVTWSGDDQAADMSGYVEGGDVHTNSGIPNHAFYLAATQLGGSSWEKAAPIWYRALPLLRPSASFAIAARATIAATALLGWDPPTRDAARNAVESAWRKVGVL
jgi:Zn-dependent metalloprotease